MRPQIEVSAPMLQEWRISVAGRGFAEIMFSSRVVVSFDGGMSETLHSPNLLM